VYVIDALSLRNTRLTITQNLDANSKIIQIVESANSSLRLENITSFFVPSQYFVFPSSKKSDKDALFINNEYTAVVRFLSHHLQCKVINKVQPELWAYITVAPHVLKRLAPRTFKDGLRSAPSTVLAGTLDTELRKYIKDSTTLLPFTYSKGILEVSSECFEKVRAILRVMPLRLQTLTGLSTVEVFVLGDSAYCSNHYHQLHQKGDMFSYSISLCKELGLTFGQVRWLVSDKEHFLANLSTVPILDPSDEELLNMVTMAITQELLQ
jgi:hypothetical protein